MSIIVPGRRPAFAPLGRLRASSLSSGKKSGFVSLNLTPMVDMFTILVVFLIQLFKASGEVELSSRITVPRTVASMPLEGETGTVVQVSNEILLLDSQPFSAEEMGSELDIPIPGMVTRLTLVREQNEKIFGRDPTKPYDGILIIQADVKTDFRIIRRIVASANGAGWAKMKFVTQPAAKPTAEGAAH
jgi:hypothetical protein